MSAARAGTGHVPPHRRLGTRLRHRLRAARPAAEAGQALVIVLGLVGLLTAGAAALAQNAIQHQTMITSDTLQHESFQALQAGIDEYLSAANTNPDFIVCNHANETSGFCANALQFDTWVPVPGVSPTDGPPAWYRLADPSIDFATGTVSLTIVGASGYSHDYSFDQGAVTLSAENDFLLNVLWIYYNQVDPMVLQQVDGLSSPPSCELYWQADPSTGKQADTLGPSQYCTAVEFVTGDTLTGNVWVKDSIFVCGSPTFQAVHTADTTLPNGKFTQPMPGCDSNNPTITNTAASTKGAATPNEKIPTTNSSLAQVAASDGCLYQGPTEITLHGSTMTVDSPDTPAAGAGASGGDGLDGASNPNQCLPTAQDPTPSLPANGVVYVQDCPTSDTGCTFDPMAGLGEMGNTGPTFGDAIVQGTLTGPLTIATANNIVIDGNLCYTSTNGCSQAPGTTLSGGSTNTDMLGLIAQNFVEINHPVQQGCSLYQYGQCWQYSYQDMPVCGTSGASPAPACDLSSPTVDGVSLAMNDSFLVNNYAIGCPLGTLTVDGTLDMKWRGPVGVSYGGGNPYCGSSSMSGYLKDYQYDSRLQYLSPPYYLNPGTPSWGLGAVTMSQTLTCKLTGCGDP